MTISASYAPGLNVGNGVSTVFAVDFPFGAAADLVVTLFDTVAEADVSPAPVLNGGATYDYTVTGTPDPDTGVYPNGSVTFNTAPLVTHIVVRARSTPQVQETVLTNNARFPAKTVEGTFDRQEMQLQERADELGRALKVQVVEGPGTDTTLPPLMGNAFKALVVNADEDGFDLGSIEGDIEQAGAYAAAAAASALIAEGVAGPTPEMYGAKGDAVISDTGAIANGSHDFSDATRTFTVADVGKTIGIMGAGAAGVTLITTIASLGATHHVNLTAAAASAGAAANAHYAYGTDDSVALAAFLAANVGKAGALQTGSTYLSTAALSSQLSFLECRHRPIVFLIGNNTSNCFTMVPPVALVNSQVNSRYAYRDLCIDALATGLDALFTKDGSPNLIGLRISNSYRDAVMLQPDGTGTPITAIENLYGEDWILWMCGRHAIHLYLKCKNDVSVQTYINESSLQAIEVRGVGRRFGSGGAGTSTAANLIRITYDTCVVNLTQNKVSTFKITGNFDAKQASSLGGAAVGDVIFHNAINGTTCRRVEHFDFLPGGLESDDGTLISGSKIVTGNAIAAGDWIECDLEQGVPFQWGLSGVDNAILSSAADGNSFLSNNPTQGAAVHKAFVKRPTDGRSLVSADTFPNGGIIDPAFKNIMSPWIQGGNVLPAGSAVNVDIPINGLPLAGTYVIQWPLKVMVWHGPYYNDPTKVSYGEYLVTLSYDLGADTAYVASTLIASKVGADLAFTFTPATGVSFSIVSSSGTLRNRLRCAITGGASVGSASSLTDVTVAASRWGLGISEKQRVNKGFPGANEFGFTL